MKMYSVELTDGSTFEGNDINKQEKINEFEEQLDELLNQDNYDLDLADDMREDIDNLEFADSE